MLAAGASGKKGKGLETLKALVEGKATLETVDENGWSALAHACRNGNEDAVAFLLQREAKVSTKANDGNTPALHAAREGANSIVKMCIEHKAGMGAKDSKGFTLLFVACETGNARLVKWLLNNKADATHRATCKRNAMMLLAGSIGDVILADMLVKRGASMNQTCGEGCTAMMMALRARNGKFAEWLMEAGADCTPVNKDGQDAMDIADSVGLYNLKSRIEMKARREERGGELEEKKEGGSPKNATAGGGTPTSSGKKSALASSSKA